MNLTDFTRYPTGNFCNADPAVRPLSAAIKPLLPGKRIAGIARTVRIAPGQNAAIHRAVHEAQEGDLLVVDGGGAERFGPFGDLLAEACRVRGITGAVFDCTVRDSADIAALGFQVFCRGFHPEATAKSDPGEIDIPIDAGGARVCPGDVVVGDDDGVVVIPKEIADGVLEKVKEVSAREEKIRSRILAGETTFDIFELGTELPPSPDRGMRPDTFFNLADLGRGIARTLAPGIDTRIFAGEQAMLSVVSFEPGSEGSIHAHPEEQWGVLLDGSGVRVQGGIDVPVAAGDFWHTPGGVEHGFRAGAQGARVLDIFAPPRAAYRRAGSGFAD